MTLHLATWYMALVDIDNSCQGIYTIILKPKRGYLSQIGKAPIFGMPWYNYTS